MFRLSLRELMVIVACVALAIVSLKYASDGWLAVIAGVTMAAFFVAIIVAAVDRGPRQAFAIGFALTMGIYGAIVVIGATKSQSFEFRSGWQLPTSRLLKYAYRVFDNGRWVNHTTGQEIPNYVPRDARLAPNMGSPIARRVMVPPQEEFMRVGHCWWGLLLAYCGGNFARFVYGRRMKEQSSA